MINKTAEKDTSYLPVAWEYRETIEEQIGKKSEGKIFYFGEGNQIEETQGPVVEMREEKNAGVFIITANGCAVRIDRIITFFGKVGAAYDEYDAYANACMDCNGGYTKEELEED